MQSLSFLYYPHFALLALIYELPLVHELPVLKLLSWLPCAHGILATRDELSRICHTYNALLLTLNYRGEGFDSHPGLPPRL